MDAATKARNEAIRRVTVKPFNAKVWTAVKCVSLQQDDFTTDDIWQMLEEMNVPAPPEPRAIGSAMNHMCKVGLIVPTGEYRYGTGDRAVKNHKRKLAVWRQA